MRVEPTGSTAFSRELFQVKRFLIFLVLIVAFGFHSGGSQAEPLVLGWEDLVPKPFTGKRMKLTKKSEVLGMPSKEDFEGPVSEEELRAFLGDIEFMKDMQPAGARLVGKLDGKKVRIPGYVTPVGFNGEDVTGLARVAIL